MQRHPCNYFQLRQLQQQRGSLDNKIQFLTRGDSTYSTNRQRSGAIPRAWCLPRPLQRSLLSHGSSVQAPFLAHLALVPPAGCAIVVASLCPALSPLSEGLPAGPHGHWSSVTSSAFHSAGSSTSVLLSLSSSSPPQSGGVSSETLASLLSLGSIVPWASLLIATSSSALRRPVSCCSLRSGASEVLVFYASQSPPPFVAVGSSCEASRPFGASPPLCAGSA